MGLSAEEARLRPLYARALGLRYLNPGGMLCFVYFEGTIALGVLLALAELVSWWAVLILPGSVAVMVKINDLVAGAVARSASRAARAGASWTAGGEVTRATHGEASRMAGGEVTWALRGRASRTAEGDVTRAARGEVSRTAQGDVTGAARGGVSRTAGGEVTRAAGGQAGLVQPARETGPDQRAGRWDGAVGRAAVVNAPAEAGRRLPAYPLNAHAAEQADGQSVRHWADHMDHADTPTQRARQSASRRYD